MRRLIVLVLVGEAHAWFGFDPYDGGGDGHGCGSGSEAPPVPPPPAPPPPSYPPAVPAGEREIMGGGERRSHASPSWKRAADALSVVIACESPIRDDSRRSDGSFAIKKR